MSFRQGVNGYADSEDTFVRRDANRTEWNNGGSDVIQVQSSGNELPVKVGIIDFQNIFGPGAGQVPAGRAIASATLRMHLKDDFFDLAIPRATGQRLGR